MVCRGACRDVCTVKKLSDLLCAEIAGIFLDSVYRYKNIVHMYYNIECWSENATEPCTPAQHPAQGTEIRLHKVTFER